MTHRVIDPIFPCMTAEPTFWTLAGSGAVVLAAFAVWLAPVLLASIVTAVGARLRQGCTRRVQATPPERRSAEPTTAAPAARYNRAW